VGRREEIILTAPRPVFSVVSSSIYSRDILKKLFAVC
jgi:hypothetical protein